MHILDFVWYLLASFNWKDKKKEISGGPFDIWSLKVQVQSLQALAEYFNKK